MLGLLENSRFHLEPHFFALPEAPLHEPDLPAVLDRFPSQLLVSTCFVLRLHGALIYVTQLPSKALIVFSFSNIVSHS